MESPTARIKEILHQGESFLIAATHQSGWRRHRRERGPGVRSQGPWQALHHLQPLRASCAVRLAGGSGRGNGHAALPPAPVDRCPGLRRGPQAGAGPGKGPCARTHGEHRPPSGQSHVRGRQLGGHRPALGGRDDRRPGPRDGHGTRRWSGSERLSGHGLGHRIFSPTATPAPRPCGLRRTSLNSALT